MSLVNDTRILLNTYQPVDELSSGYKQRMLTFLQQHEGGAFVRDTLEGHFTASAWILSPEKNDVLLIYHNKLQAWLQPGGHFEGDATVMDAALREAKEESQWNSFKIVSSELWDIDIHTIPARGDVPEHFHYDLRVCLTVEDMGDTSSFDANEVSGMEWVSLVDLLKTEKRSSILRMLHQSLSLTK